MFGLTLITCLGFYTFGAKRSVFAEQHHVSTSALSRNCELYDVVWRFHDVYYAQKDFFGQPLFGHFGCEQSAQNNSGRPGVECVRYSQHWEQGI